jgi:hypothetical protein
MLPRSLTYTADLAKKRTGPGIEIQGPAACFNSSEAIVEERAQEAERAA